MDDEKNRLPSQDLIDQSKLVNKRARRKVAGSRERIRRAEHRWMQVTLGRICGVCRLIQSDGEFEDESPCPGRNVS